jgi:hypothetical protein
MIASTFLQRLEDWTMKLWRRSFSATPSTTTSSSLSSLWNQWAPKEEVTNQTAIVVSLNKRT